MKRIADMSKINLTVSLFFFAAWKPGSQCPPLLAPWGGVVSCFSSGGVADCGSRLFPGTTARFRCERFYELEGADSMLCRVDGSWSSPRPRCVPECGRRSAAVALIVSGVTSVPGAFPWHVAIYNVAGKSGEYWCGGSLISEFAVLTAAHCTWKIAAENLILAFGKFHQNFDFQESGVQKIKAKRIESLTSYQDVVGNYNGDISVIFLETPVSFSRSVTPVCLDWDQRFVDGHLTEGSMGAVVGWGLTENDTFSDTLRVSKLPVASDQKCIAEQESDFKKFVTYTSFCAGYNNGTGVCNGDSGGGLVFVDRTSDRWYLQGLVSVSPRKKGTPFCDPNFYSVFTKVSLFTKWLKSILSIEEKMREKFLQKVNTSEKKLKEKKWNVYEHIRKYFQWQNPQMDDERFAFPHSEKILKSAGLALRPVGRVATSHFLKAKKFSSR